MKNKIINIYMNNMNKKFVLLQGSRCSGKSTICNFFNKKHFSCFQLDKYNNYCNKKVCKKFIQTLKNAKNEYNPKKEYYYNDIAKKIMFEDSLKCKSNVVFDMFEQSKLINFLKKKNLINNLYIINVFANLETIFRNLKEMKNENEPRTKFVFTDFSETYIKTYEDNPKKIEKINRNNFKNLLLKHLKYEFTDKTHLINFANDIFKKMEIDDDNDHYIRVRDNIKYDYLLNTSNKSKTEIFKELQENVFNNNKFFLNNTNSKTRKKLSK